MRLKRLILTITALMIVSTLTSCGGAPDSANAPDAPKEPEKKAEPAEQPEQPEGGGGEAAPAAQQAQEEEEEVPEDETLRITVPKMARIQDDTIPTTAGDDEAALKENAAIHLEGTGFPWEEEANVYVAGHRLGYPNTNSFLAFWDLDALEDGDEITVKDANDREYVYEVTEEFDVAPTDLYVLDPVEGKNILTLQTCTLPDYSRRLIVQAELKA